MSELLGAMAAFFKEEEWPHTQLEGESSLQAGAWGESGQWTCFVHARDELSQLVFYSVCPVNAPEPKRLILAELLTRANYGLIIGNFEMDFEDGEIRYKTAIDVEGDRLSSALARGLAVANVTTMDRYLPGILRVIYGDASPAAVLAEIEG